MDCIKSRPSVREFREEPISDSVMDELLRAAVSAPSAKNSQDWEFIVVREPEVKKGLSRQFMTGKAPVVVVVCSNGKRNMCGSKGESLFSIQDTAAATQNLMLAAWAKGIGSCWIGAFDEDEVRELLELPEHVRPLAVIPLGYPSSGPSKPGRLPLGDVVHKERF